MGPPAAVPVASKGITVTAPDGSVHPFDNEQQAQAFRDLIKQAGQ